MEFIEEFCFNCVIAGIDIDKCITRLEDMGYTNCDAIAERIYNE